LRIDWPFLLAVLLAPIFLSGCLKTSYQPLALSSGPQAKEESFFERRVDFQLTNSFFAAAPSCAAIVTKSPASPAIVRLVEESVERHLATRLPRVISGGRLRRVETTLGIDMASESDRRVFARQLRCNVVVEIDLGPVEDNYFVVWAQRGLTINLAMRGIMDGKLLWQARHTAGRADGGLPISIIDLPMSAVRAGMLRGDPELFASIADDAVRRMMKTLPDIRGTASVGGLSTNF